MLKLPWALIQCCIRMRDVLRLEGLGEKLSRQKPQMIVDWKLFGLGMEVVNGGSVVAPQC